MPNFFFLLLLRLILPITADNPTNFTFNGFRQPAAATLFLNGVAQIQNNGILRLTSETPRLLGHAFYKSPIRFKTPSSPNASSFSTSFAFAILPEYQKLGGHGFAFTISTSPRMPNSLPSQYLGLMNASQVGNLSNHVFAVEFDTVQDFEFGDINDNHIGIDLDSLVSNVSVNATLLVQGKKEEFNLKSGRTIQAWIDYDSSTQQLDVTLSDSSTKPANSILSSPVDLSPIFLDYMYVGFSASTGLLASSHYILGWSFAVNGEAQSLDLASLPSLPRPKKNHLPVVLGTSLSIAILLLLGVLTTLYAVWRIKNRDVVESWELDVGPHRFSYSELKKATKGFRDKELLGFGGFGKVYRGTLPDTNVQVAVKRINNESKQGLREFASEISSIGHLRHRNLVALQGWCRRRGDLLLVYDFMPNRSLDKYIFDEPKTVLNWEQRFNILRGVASGLLYLHEGWEQTVIHRDIKAGNVLLDSEMNARVGDFGLAKLYEHGVNPSTTKVVGTLGYLAPELTRTGKPTTGSDVFAFGALVLEVVCGRRPVEAKALPEELVLIDWVWEKCRTGCVLEVVDRKLGGEYNETEVIAAIKLGLICSNNDPGGRPSMREVVRYLEGEIPLPEVVVLPDKQGEKGSSEGARFGLGLENLEHSFLTSSYPRYDDDDDEGQSASTFSESGKGDKWR